jgi:hypothetical protein
MINFIQTVPDHRPYALQRRGGSKPPLMSSLRSECNKLEKGRSLMQDPPNREADRAISLELPCPERGVFLTALQCTSGPLEATRLGTGHASIGHLEEQHASRIGLCRARCPRLDTDPFPLSRSEPCAQHRRARHHGRAADSALVFDVGDPRSRLLALPAARGAGRGLSGAAFHDPTRLRSWCLLPSPFGQRLGRTRDWGVDAHAI